MRPNEVIGNQHRDLARVAVLRRELHGVPRSGTPRGKKVPIRRCRCGERQYLRLGWATDECPENARSDIGGARADGAPPTTAAGAQRWSRTASPWSSCAAGTETGTEDQEGDASRRAPPRVTTRGRIRRENARLHAHVGTCSQQTFPRMDGLISLSEPGYPPSRPRGQRFSALGRGRARL